MNTNTNFSTHKPGANGAQNSSAVSNRGRNVTLWLQKGRMGHEWGGWV